MLVCGFNSFGQLERLVNAEENETPNSICRFQRSQKTNITRLAFAWNHIVLVENDGTILVNGHVGNRIEKMNHLVDVPFKSADIRQVICSPEKMFCVTTDGQAWEYNYGLKNWRNLKPILPLTEVEGLELKVIKLSIGVTMAAVLVEDGRIFALPNEPLPVPPQLGLVVDLDCGHEHGVLLTSTGQVMTWGTALRGQLGNEDVDTSPTPSEVQALSGIKCSAIAAGGWHTCAISADGDLYSWGWNKFGQLGHPRPQDNLENGVFVAYLPVIVDLPVEAGTIKAVFCGTGHTVVLSKNGELWGCGWNKYGQLGLGDEECVISMRKLNFPPDVKIKSVICGSWNSAVICEE